MFVEQCTVFTSGEISPFHIIGRLDYCTFQPCACYALLAPYGGLIYIPFALYISDEGHPKTLRGRGGV